LTISVRTTRTTSTERAGHGTRAQFPTFERRRKRCAQHAPRLVAHRRRIETIGSDFEQQRTGMRIAALAAVDPYEAESGMKMIIRIRA